MSGSLTICTTASLLRNDSDIKGKDSDEISYIVSAFLIPPESFCELI